MSDREWLANAQQGDAVLVVGRTGTGRSVGRIARLTKTRIMVRVGEGPETAYRVTDGYEVGADIWSGNKIEEATPEILTATRNENRRLRLARELNHRNWDNLPLEILDAVSALLK